MSAFGLIVVLLGIIAVYAIMFGALRPHHVLRAPLRLLLFVFGRGIAILMTLFLRN